MNLELDDDLRLLGESLSGWLAQHLPFERRREMRDATSQAGLWNEMNAALGLAGAGLPESWGGFGRGCEAHMVVAEALGAALAPTPYVESAVLSGTLLESLQGQDELGAQLAAGRIVITAWEEPQSRGDATSIGTAARADGNGWKISGLKRAVRWAGEADALLVSARTADGPSIFRVALDAPGMDLRAYRLIDDHPASDITFSDSPATLLASGADAADALSRAIDAATAATCAEGTGLMRTLLDDTIAYTRERKQFGQPLASFQVLQHRMVDMRIAVEESSAAALLAALRADDPAAVSAAKTTVGEAVRKIGQEAVQLHGAMGLTEELRVGHYFRRTTAIENQFGDADRHLARYRALKTA
ncbi:acyl-CoA dehydrogenase [Novosphingobium sp. ZN18A2]|uniref:acyl-CoA dehydrogenase family protein n=1 Tax=Novosphingobium sp. ZN18A2 TaxID=3079861 RepID=UPI0030D1ADCE